MYEYWVCQPHYEVSVKWLDKLGGNWERLLKFLIPILSRSDVDVDDDKRLKIL